jgi:hypothetical protein
MLDSPPQRDVPLQPLDGDRKQRARMADGFADIEQLSTDDVRPDGHGAPQRALADIDAAHDAGGRCRDTARWRVSRSPRARHRLDRRSPLARESPRESATAQRRSKPRDRHGIPPPPRDPLQAGRARQGPGPSRTRSRGQHHWTGAPHHGSPTRIHRQAARHVDVPARVARLRCDSQAKYSVGGTEATSNRLTPRAPRPSRLRARPARGEACSAWCTVRLPTRNGFRLRTALDQVVISPSPRERCRGGACRGGGRRRRGARRPPRSPSRASSRSSPPRRCPWRRGGCAGTG